jgi:hypothetical protein
VSIRKQRNEQLLDNGLLANDGGADALLEIEDLVVSSHEYCVFVLKALPESRTRNDV